MCRADDQGRGSQVESMASRRKMLLEILNYRGFIGDDNVSLSAVGSWEEVLLFSMDFTVSQNFLELVLQEANFCLKKVALAFLTACVYLFLTSLKVAYHGGYSMLMQYATGCFCAGQGQSGLE